MQLRQTTSPDALVSFSDFLLERFGLVATMQVALLASIAAHLAVIIGVGFRLPRIPAWDDPHNVMDVVLAARADVPAEDLRRRFPQQLKIGPSEKIGDLVRLALPGVGVHAVPVAPRQIPYHAGFAYFELDQNDDLWKQLKNSGGIALHVGGEFPGLAMEFWAIRS